MMKHRTLFFLPLLCLSACSGGVKILDDIDLQYYAHHIEHKIVGTATKVKVTIKLFGSSEAKTYSFDLLIWSTEDGIWTTNGNTEEYENDGTPLEYAFCDNSILNDDTVYAFINNIFGITFYMDYYSFEDGAGPNKEYNFAGRLAKKDGSKLSLYSQWNVIAYTEKTWHEEGEEEGMGYYEYDENAIFLPTIVRAIYKGEKLVSFGCYVCHKFYFMDEDADGRVDYHEDVFKSPIDYCEYRVSFS